jgi:diguanylate cyclase (GGDEF)-like protein/PAS domain S-box-containing protein
MTLLAQFDVFGTPFSSKWELTARLLAQHPAQILWAAFLLLLCISACVGALAHRRFSKNKQTGQLAEPLVDELTMLRAVTASVPDFVYVKDTQSRFLLANRSTAEAMGAKSVSDLLGKTDLDFYPRELAEGFLADELEVIRTGQPLVSRDEVTREIAGEIRYTLSTKVPLRDAAGEIIGIIGIGRDITALKHTETALKKAQEKLQFKASHDALTTLLNRDAILEMLEREIVRGDRNNGSTIVLLGDLDYFKNINDAHGHQVGDEVLRAIADRLVGAVRVYDYVGRYGGEEFLVILAGGEEVDAAKRADQIREAITASPIPTSHGPIRVTLSLGVLSVRDWDHLTTQEILREVDVALYEAKGAGRNQCRLARPLAASRAHESPTLIVTGPESSGIC